MKNAVKIAITNKKGGVAKTTTALALTAALQNKGYKTLMIDSDPQCNSTKVYKAQTADKATLYDIFFNNLTADKCIQHTDYGDIVPSDELLQNADSIISPSPKMYKYIKKAISCVESEYDFIIFDTPPNVGVLVGNVLIATDYIITPLTCDGFAIQGLSDFYQIVEDYKEDNENLKYLGLLIIKYKGMQNLTKELETQALPEFAKQLNTRLFDTKIRECVKSQEAQTLNKSIFEHAPKCTTALDYKYLTDEILTILKI